jgi:hypothetical protein
MIDGIDLLFVVLGLIFLLVISELWDRDNE